MTLADRFWPKVDRSGGPDACWIWTAAKFGNGYGMILNDGRLQGAHRIAWSLVHGEIPVGQQVLHSCDNRPCVNPAHLRLGTHRDNMDDMVARLRFVHGRAHHSNILTEDEVREIRHRLAAGESRARIAIDYRVSRHAVRHIQERRSWAWLD